MNMREGWVACVLLVVFALAFVAGINAGASLAPDACDKLGKFENDGIVYECHQIPYATHPQ